MKRIIPAALIALALGCSAAVAQQQQPSSPLPAAVGGTGVNNGTFTATFGGNLVTGGAFTLPAGTTDFSATGGTNQVVQQSSLGGPLTVGPLATTNMIYGLILGSAP